MDKDYKTKAIDGIHDDILDDIHDDDGIPAGVTLGVPEEATGVYMEEDEVATHDTSDTIHAVIDNNVFVNEDGSLAIVEPIDNNTVYGPPSWFEPGNVDPVDPNGVDPIPPDMYGPDPSILDINSDPSLDDPVIGDDIMTE